MTALTANEKHVLRLTAKGADAEGWAKVSKILWQFVTPLPDELLEKRPSDDGGHVRLTPLGQKVLQYTAT